MSPKALTPQDDKLHSPTLLSHAFFILTGIPGLAGVQAWLTEVFGPMYLLSLLGNGALLAVMQTDSTLHQPMFLLLATLAATDLSLATSL